MTLAPSDLGRSFWILLTLAASISPLHAGDGYFTLGESEGRSHLVTPAGRPYLALGINHLQVLSQPTKGGVPVRGEEDWREYWNGTLEPRFRDWNVTTLGYGAPPELRSEASWFGTMSLAPIEKHRSDPRPNVPGGFRFPDVFDPDWQRDVQDRIRRTVTPRKDDPNLIGWMWTDTPTWDLRRTRALRRTDWVSALRELPTDAPGRRAYSDFLVERYEGRLDEFVRLYSVEVESFEDLRNADLSNVAIGRHRVHDDDERFLARIAQRFYSVVGRAQREADANHLVFGDRYLAGDAPRSVLEAAKPWIDAVAVQPGDRYSTLYPPSTEFPEAALEELHRITGKPVLICDHAISFPTEKQPRTIFEQRPTEAEAAEATARFLKAAFEKPWIVGYLRCQYVDRPASFGRGLRQGLLRADGTPRESLVRVYREGFAKAQRRLPSR